MRLCAVCDAGGAAYRRAYGIHLAKKSDLPAFPDLNRDLHADVFIIGGGALVGSCLPRVAVCGGWKGAG